MLRYEACGVFAHFKGNDFYATGDRKSDLLLRPEALCKSRCVDCQKRIHRMKCALDFELPFLRWESVLVSDETTNAIENKTITQAGRFVLRGGYVTNEKSKFSFV